MYADKLGLLDTEVMYRQVGGHLIDFGDSPPCCFRCGHRVVRGAYRALKGFKPPDSLVQIVPLCDYCHESSTAYDSIGLVRRLSPWTESERPVRALYELAR